MDNLCYYLQLNHITIIELIYDNNAANWINNITSSSSGLHCIRVMMLKMVNNLNMSTIIITPWNFIYYNILLDYSSAFGVQPLLWYITQVIILYW